MCMTSLLCVYVLNKTCKWEVSRRSRAVTAKKCTDSVIYVQSCCYANLNPFSPFLPFLLPSPSSLVTLIIISPDRANCRQSMRISVFLQMSFLFFKRFLQFECRSS